MLKRRASRVVRWRDAKAHFFDRIFRVSHAPGERPKSWMIEQQGKKRASARERRKRGQVGSFGKVCFERWLDSFFSDVCSFGRPASPIRDALDLSRGGEICADVSYAREKRGESLDRGGT